VNGTVLDAPLEPESDLLFLFPATLPTALWKRHIERRYPTQAKVRLEWGTQHLLPV
jgi:hypothetical protein